MIGCLNAKPNIAITLKHCILYWKVAVRVGLEPKMDKLRRSLAILLKYHFLILIY